MRQNLPSVAFLTMAVPSVLAQGWGSGITEAGSWGSVVQPGWGQATATANAIASPTSTVATESSPPSAGCTWHGNHWDCPEEEDSTSGSDCVIHVGHAHGDCTPEQLASCDTTQIGDYNMGLHIGAIFIVLVTSGLGVLIPLYSSRQKKTLTEQESADAQTGKGGGVLGNVFFICKHFGTGIILATSFIHLLFHGFVMFANTCVGHLNYESTAPAIAMASAFLTFLLDFFGARHLANQRGKKALASGSLSPQSISDVEKTSRNAFITTGNETQFTDLGHGHHHHRHTQGGICHDQDQKWQVLVLEAGIVFHSIMIGVTLGATGGNGWTTLLIVIIFHQFFEGLALGARIALLSFSSLWKPVSMGLAFTLITPIGIAIGLGVHSGFSANGKAALLSVGILNSISAGILLYAAFEVLSNDFTSGALKSAPISRVLVALVAMTAGMTCMSVLGKWA